MNVHSFFVGTIYSIGGDPLNAISLFVAELAKMKEKKGVLLSVIAVLLIPLLYAAITLSQKWGPYDHLDNLPVAVVNKDKGATSFGKEINVGKDLVSDLQKNKALGWEFADQEEATAGLNNQKYYMVIEIPENFSQNITTVLDPSPKKAELKFIQNEGKHFMASQVTKNAIEKLRTQLSTKVTETYVKNVFSQLKDVSSGFQKAADGSEKLYEGSTALNNGTTQIVQTLVEKSDSIRALANGSKELLSGTGQLSSTLASKQADISKLAAGSNELKNGTQQMLQTLQQKSDSISQLANGAKQLNDGTGLLLSSLKEKSASVNQLAQGAKNLEKGTVELSNGAALVLEGLKKSQTGSATLKGGLAQLEPGSSAVANGATQAEGAAKQLAGGVSSLSAGLNAILAQNPSLQTNKDFMTLVETSKVLSTKISEYSNSMTNLKNGAAQVEAGIKQATAGSAALDNGLLELVAGQTKVSGGAQQLVAGSKQISDGNATVSAGWNTLSTNVEALHAGSSRIKTGNATVESGWNSLTAGVNQLNAGAMRIADGNQSVNAGWQALSSGANKLQAGMQQVSDGNATVASGWTTLTDGVTQVDQGLLKLKSGSNELATGLKSGAESTKKLNANDNNYEMFSAPVELAGDVINKYPFYRDSNAPYVLSLSLFIGILVMSFIVDFAKPAHLPNSGFSWFFSKFLKLSLLAIIQALIVSIFTLVFLNLKVENGFLFILFTIGVSLSLLMIVMFLVSFAGNFGRFIALALIILQLSTTGSSLPIEMLPVYLRNLSPFLPLTYSIDGYRNVITLGDVGNVFGNIGVLAGYFLGFALLAFAVYMVKFKKLQTEAE